MTRFKSILLLLALSAFMGCAAQPEGPKKQEMNRAEQTEKQNPPTPTVTYRPGAGLMIEGH